MLDGRNIISGKGFLHGFRIHICNWNHCWSLKCEHNENQCEIRTSWTLLNYGMLMWPFLYQQNSWNCSLHQICLSFFFGCVWSPACTLLSRIFTSEENSIKRALIIHNARFRLVLHFAGIQNLPLCFSAAPQVWCTVQPATKCCWSHQYKNHVFRGNINSENVSFTMEDQKQQNHESINECI